jgi:peptide/nickel transport system permease protein
VTAFLIRRLMQSIVVVFIMSIVVFFGVNVVGDPIDMLISPDATQAEIEATIRSFGLDRPVWEQYWHFLLGALNGNLGKSFIFGTPALPLILQRMPATMELAISALVLAVFVGIPLGLYSGLKPNAISSRTIMAGSILGFSLPTFWVGLMLIMIFAVMLGWLPSTGRGPTAEFLGIRSSLLHGKAYSMCSCQRSIWRC